MARNSPGVQDLSTGRQTLHACGQCREPIAADARFCTRCGWSRAGTPAGDQGVIVIDEAGRADVVARSSLPPLPERAAPVVVSTKAPTDPKKVKRRSLVIIAVSVVACLLSVGLLLMLREPGPPEIDVDLALSEGAATLESTVREFQGNRLLAEYDAAAQTADEASDTYAERLDEVEGVEDEAVQAATLRVLRAERRTLREFATVLAGMEGADLANWPDASIQVSEAIDGLAAAQESLVDLEDEDITATVNVDVARNTLQGIDRRMARKLTTYQAWEELSAARTAEKNAEQGAYSAYVGATQPLIDRYSESREALQSWVSALDTSASLPSIRAALGTHGAARFAIYNELLQVQPTPAFTSVHIELVNLIEQAVGVVRTANDAVDEWEAAPFLQFPTVQDTPLWQIFRSESDRIGAEYTGILARWQQISSSEQGRINSIQIPPEPQL